jgi:hypothetical protein
LQAAEAQLKVHEILKKKKKKKKRKKKKTWTQEKIKRQENIYSTCKEK